MIASCQGLLAKCSFAKSTKSSIVDGQAAKQRPVNYSISREVACLPSMSYVLNSESIERTKSRNWVKGGLIVCFHAITADIETLPVGRVQQ